MVHIVEPCTTRSLLRLLTLTMLLWRGALLGLPFLLALLRIEQIQINPPILRDCRWVKPCLQYDVRTVTTLD